MTTKAISKQRSVYGGILLYGLVIFYLIAGVNHFLNPEFYYDLIPDYLPWKRQINSFSGVAEVGLALMIADKAWRKTASVLLIAMLLAFIPAHVYFIQIGSCVEGGLCVPDWVSWVRLVVIHPVLILWAWWAGFRYNRT